MTTSPTPMGAATPLGQPGARSGYLQIIRPPLSLYYVPGFQLHPAVVVAAQSGDFVMKFGTLLAKEKASGMYKVAVKTAGEDWEVSVTPTDANDQGDIVGPILPSLNTLYDPSVLGSGSVAIPFTSWFDAQTDRIDSGFTDAAIGMPVTAGPNGDLAKAVTGDPVIAVVTQVQSQITSVPGGTPVTVLTLSYKGTSITPWIF